ncbi:MAG: hypothetical protein IT373_16010 [Polyangiaceae bacterium]|nr:hypothetical protein [Polyangiaceae bacterium]
MSLLAPNPARRAVERYWLGYTAVWGGAAAAVMLSGVAERWSDAELVPFGVGLGLGAVVPPVVRPHPSERARRWRERTAFKAGLSVIGFAFLWNYFCTPYFFEVLHMHYGFRTALNLRQNPVFLYPLTVAYFATYFVLVSVADRLAQRARAPAARRVLGLCAPFAVAFLETALNANPFMRRLFCYDEPGFMLWFGTLSYGLCFVCARPVWCGIDARPLGPVVRREGQASSPAGFAATSLRAVVVGVLAATMVVVIALELLRHLVAPAFTVVRAGAPGLRDYGASCLGPVPTE